MYKKINDIKDLRIADILWIDLEEKGHMIGALMKVGEEELIIKLTDDVQLIVSISCALEKIKKIVM